MSYPIVIQPLIIEDEPGAKAGYESMFAELAERYMLAPCCYAFCYDHAVHQLDMDRIFHLVILDLKLPRAEGTPPVEGVDLGEALLVKCIDRDQYPIPAMLVVSGHIDAADQGKLRSTTEAGFAYGQVLVKAPSLTGEIERAIQAVLKYCGFGIHLRDGGERRYPTISPREDDLLRRTLQPRPHAIGIDLAWWSADNVTTPPSARPEWTKVLMGRILFRGDRPSRLNFFKLMSASSGLAAIDAAQRLAQKLSHVKLNAVLSSAASALIVTEKVGSRDSRPTPLSEFLLSASVPEAEVARVGTQIVEQLAALGDRRPQSKARRLLLWRYHNEALISKAWMSYAPNPVPPALAEFAGPTELFLRLSTSDDVVFYEEQTFVHGDLHLGNVALDIDPAETDAFIFDAGGTEANVSVRDVATLEVCALLHQDIDDASFERICEDIYSRDVFIPAADRTLEGPAEQNARELIRQLRMSIAERVSPEIFALMVFDYALVQLGGLTFGLSRGKVRNPYHAALLACYAGHWYEQVTKSV